MYKQINTGISCASKHSHFTHEHIQNSQSSTRKSKCTTDHRWRKIKLTDYTV